MDETQIQLAGDDVDLPEDLRKMVDEDQDEEEEKDSILGQLQNLQNMDLDTIKEKAQATFTEIKQSAEQKCSVMWEGQTAFRKMGLLGVGMTSTHYNLANISRETMMLRLSTTGM